MSRKKETMEQCTRWRYWGIVVMVVMVTQVVGSLRWSFADSLPEAVTIDELLLLLREQSPRLSAERTQIDIAAADIIGAEVLPNPSISYGAMHLLAGKNTLFDGDRQQQSILELPLLIAGQRPARREAAQRGVDAARARFHVRYADLARQVWQRFVQLLAGQERVRTLEDSRASLQHLTSLVSGRAQSGAASEYDVVRMTVEAAAVDARLAAARAEILNSAGEIGALLGLPGWRPRAVGQLKPERIDLDVDRLWSHAEEAHPAIETARREEVAAGSALERAYRERWPIPTVSWGPFFTNNPFGLASYAGLSVAIPLFDRGQGPVARAQAEQRSARLNRQAVMAETRAELERATSLLTQRQATLAAFERDVLSQLPTLRRMGEDAYRLGKGSFLELLDATRSQTELQLTHLDLVEAVMQAEIDTRAAAGFLAATGVRP